MDQVSLEEKDLKTFDLSLELEKKQGLCKESSFVRSLVLCATTSNQHNIYDFLNSKMHINNK